MLAPRFTRYRVTHRIRFHYRLLLVSRDLHASAIIPVPSRERNSQVRGDSTIRARPACQPTDIRLVESAFVKPFAENFIFPAHAHAHAHAPRVFLITSGVTAPVAARIQVEPTSREQAATERRREKYRREAGCTFRGIFGRSRKGEEGRAASREW